MASDRELVQRAKELLRYPESGMPLYDLGQDLVVALERTLNEVDRLEAVNNIIGIECVGHQEKYRIYREENAELRARISKLEVEISLAVAAPKWDLVP